MLKLTIAIIEGDATGLKQVKRCPYNLRLLVARTPEGPVRKIVDDL